MDTSVPRTARIWNHLPDGLDFVEPGVVSVTGGKPGTDVPEIDRYGTVGRKP
ncbi:hypothetical protein ACIA8K_32200 [Catenuloplanes sp. NPDC051500]|uniref:hypothetical protein n=1 Tax=Catenuloplanes sp. NPDC051500 TaxID=3363959 RepID=UPI00378F3CC6